jgi:MFS family permease
MDVDLHMDNSSSKYSIALLIFFVGYLLFEIPSNLILVRSRPSIYLPSIMLTWGSMTLIYMAIHNFAGLVVLRFALGIVESGFFPGEQCSIRIGTLGSLPRQTSGVLLLLSSWYKREELSKRFAIFYSASIISGAFGGILAAAVVGGLEGYNGIRGWRWLYMIEGVCTVSISLCAFFILPNFPRSTSWLTPREKALAIKRLAIQAVSESSGRHVNNREGAKMAFSDWKTWVLTVGYAAESGAGTISYFIPTIVGQLGYKGTDAQWYSAPPYAVAFVFSLAINFHADWRREKVFHTAIPIFCTGIFAIVQATGHLSHIASYVLLCLVGAGIWSSLPCFLSYAIIVLGEPPAKRAGKALNQIYIQAFADWIQWPSLLLILSVTLLRCTARSSGRRRMHRVTMLDGA